MNFGVIQFDDYYNNIPQRLRHYAPGFASVSDDKEIYLMLFEFGEFMERNVNDDSIRTGCILFLNEAIEQGQYKTEDAIVLQVFHQLYESPDTFRIIRSGLGLKALTVFDKSYSDYKENTPDNIYDE
ncbi:MAG: hypothetical protein QM781_04840 [Chitinophagaceae bacterium]